MARWPGAPSRWTPGYTLLLPVPGDIPVFVELALRVCGEQAAEHRVRTLVVSDRPSPAIEAIVDRARAGWSGTLDLAYLPRPERWMLPYMKSGSRNHGMQLVAGVSASTTTHVVLHDADLFLLDPHLLESQYRTCRDRQLHCLGVCPVWDAWFADRGLRLAATWEMVASVPWLRSYPPYRQIGHDSELAGERHTFDTTLYAQALTPASKVDWVDRGQDLVHFNYVITTYRNFQRHGSGFADDHFRLLLIALFIHLFSSQPPPEDLPPLADLATGVGRAGAAVRYPRDPDHASAWADFRGRLDRMLAAPYLDRAAVARATEALAVFDDYYAGRRAD